MTDGGTLKGVGDFVPHGFQCRAHFEASFSSVSVASFGFAGPVTVGLGRHDRIAFREHECLSFEAALNFGADNVRRALDPKYMAAALGKLESQQKAPGHNVSYSLPTLRFEHKG